MSRRLVLASASPRRREILERLDLEFESGGVDIDETPRPGEAPADYVVRLAATKAAARAAPDVVTIGADTTVVLDGRILGKPNGADAARAMLTALSGRSHHVLTGVAVVVDGQRTATACETSVVLVRTLTPERIDWYTSIDEPFDKAGAYALQGAGALFADHVQGSVSNVIGLPLPTLDATCRRVDVELLAFRRTA